jgi:GntR family transcriptional regulator
MINRNIKVPFYYQLYEILLGKIVRGEWKPGDLLPTENDLLEQYQVSRSTVRQALDLLVGEGKIYRQRGRGSFVAHPPVDQALNRIISFTEDMRRRGLEPRTHVLASELVPAPDDIARRLKIEPGEELARLERLRLADDEPMSLEEAFLVHRLCQGVLDQDYAHFPLRETLKNKYGIRLTHARQNIRAVSAPKKIARILSIQPNTALLYIERVSFSDQEVPVEYIRFYHRGDRYVLHNELQG